MEFDFETVCEKALEACMNGRVHQDLKLLYLAQYRNKVDWTRFPFWAIPNAETEGCHEG
jgi:hypothetical protein